MLSQAADAGDVTTVNVISALPEGEPQGSFVVRAEVTATGRDLLRQVCSEAKIPLRLNYVLTTSDGHLVSMTQQLRTVRSIQEGQNVYLNTQGWTMIKYTEDCKALTVVKHLTQTLNCMLHSVYKCKNCFLSVVKK